MALYPVWFLSLPCNLLLLFFEIFRPCILQPAAQNSPPLYARMAAAALYLQCQLGKRTQSRRGSLAIIQWLEFHPQHRRLGWEGVQVSFHVFCSAIYIGLCSREEEGGGKKRREKGGEGEFKHKGKKKRKERNGKKTVGKKEKREQRHKERGKAERKKPRY